jgi:hypothetical protein
MKEELDRYFKEARASIKDNAVLEGVVTGMKAVIIEATGDCPCGDPDCNGHCRYGLETEETKEPEGEKKPEEPVQEADEKTPMQVIEEARGDTPKDAFVQALREAIEQVDKAPLKTRLKQKLEKYANS